MRTLSPLAILPTRQEAWATMQGEVDLRKQRGRTPSRFTSEYDFMVFRLHREKQAAASVERQWSRSLRSTTPWKGAPFRSGAAPLLTPLNYVPTAASNQLSLERSASLSSLSSSGSSPMLRARPPPVRSMDFGGMCTPCCHRCLIVRPSLALLTAEPPLRLSLR